MKIAVVGTGISGMTAAHLLCREHEVVVYEAADYVGGHTNTVDVSLDGKNHAVDTGFIVFNEKTYPNFVKLMKKLGVAWQKSVMSFSVKCYRTGLEFCPSSLASLFVQRRNIVEPRFYRMLFDALRFKMESPALLKDRSARNETLFEYLKRKKYSSWFVDHFIIPMGASIWSSDPEKFKEFPARFFAEFFDNHGILNIMDQPQWLVIENGSRSYIGPLTRGFRDRIRLNSPVDKITREKDRVRIEVRGLEPEYCDHVVIAAHSDQALAMLGDPSEKEREILGAIAYQKNETVLHTDESVLPENRAAWASWNYHIPPEEKKGAALTYNMNILQGISAEKQFCVTLNFTEAVSNRKIIKSLVYHHPVYTPSSLAARKRHHEINGVNRTSYCGAYWFYGFHEDGVKSALEVAKPFGLAL